MSDVIGTQGIVPKIATINELLQAGVIACEVVQTGPDSSVLIATYADKAAADAVAEKAAALRAEGQEEFKGDVPTVLEGEVIVTM